MPYTRSRLQLVLVLVTFLVQVSYVPDGAPANPGKPYQYTVPEAANDGWEITHVRSENIWNDNALWLQPVEMLQQYILPAVQ